MPGRWFTISAAISLGVHLCGWVVVLGLRRVCTGFDGGSGRELFGVEISSEVSLFLALTGALWTGSWIAPAAWLVLAWQGRQRPGDAPRRTVPRGFAVYPIAANRAAESASSDRATGL